MRHHHRCWRANASAMPAPGSQSLSRLVSCLVLDYQHQSWTAECSCVLSCLLGADTADIWRLCHIAHIEIG